MAFCGVKLGGDSIDLWRQVEHMSHSCCALERIRCATSINSIQSKHILFILLNRHNFICMNQQLWKHHILCIQYKLSPFLVLYYNSAPGEITEHQCIYCPFYENVPQTEQNYTTNQILTTYTWQIFTTKKFYSILYFNSTIMYMMSFTNRPSFIKCQVLMYLHVKYFNTPIY